MVTLYLKSYYGVEGSSDCTDPTNGTPLQHEGHNLRCIDFTDTHGVTQLADVLEVASGSAVDGICQCPDGYEIWDPQSYEHATEIYEKVGSDFQWTTPTDQNFAYAPNAQCSNYLCSHVSHKFSVSDDTDDKATVQHGAWPRFKYTATEDAEVHFLDTSTQSLSARLVHGAAPQPASYVNGLPIVAAVDRCGWEIPAWTLQGVANFELGATNFSVRVLEADEVDEAKYYYPYGDLSNTDHGLEVRDCNATERADMVNASNDIMLRGCRAKIPEVRECGEGETPANKKCQTERLPCATMDHTYVDELPVTRNFARDLSDLAAADMVDFEIISPLCLDSVMVTGTKLQQLIDPPGNGGSREDKYALAGDEKLLLLSELPEPQEEGLYGTACSPQTGAVFREGDAVELEFKLVEREPKCLNNDDLYPWDDCSKYKNIDPLPAHDSLPTDRQIKLRVADGVSGIEDSDEYAGTATFKHIMTVGEPNPFAPFSHELSVEFSRAFDAAKILFVRHVLVLGSIPEEVPQVWTVATNPTLIFSIIRDPPGGASTATLVEGSTISTSMAIDGSHAAQLEDSFTFGASLGLGLDLATVLAPFGVGVQKNVAQVGIKAGYSRATTPNDISVSRSSSRHFDIGISFGVGISTSDSPYIAGQPSDVIIGGGANLRFISAIEIYAKMDPDVTGGLCLGGLTALEFLPEQISTWVMSVYEIEKTIERIGAALTDPNTKIEKMNASDASIPDPRDDLVEQIENWRTVLANYRAVTVRDQAESVAEQLTKELNSIHESFKDFLKDTTTGGSERDQFSDFLSHGLNKLEENGGDRINYHAPRDNVDKAPGGSEASEKAKEMATVAGRSRTVLYENHVLIAVNSAYTECVDKVALVEPGGEARLCDVYRDIHANLELKSSLFGICDFAKKGDCCDAGADGAKCDEDKDELCTCCDASLRTCKKEEVTCTTLSAVHNFCKEGPYRTGRTGDENMISAFDALSNTEHFITFSGTNGL